MEGAKMIKEINKDQLRKLLLGEQKTDDNSDQPSEKSRSPKKGVIKRNQRKEIVDKIKAALPNYLVDVDHSYHGMYITIDGEKKIIFYEVMHRLGFIVGRKIYPEEYKMGLTLLEELKEKLPTWHFGFLDDMERHGTEVSITPYKENGEKYDAAW